jgi:hypothetical protein
MEPQGSISCSAQPATGLCPQPNEYTSHPHTVFKIHFNIIPINNFKAVPNVNVGSKINKSRLRTEATYLVTNNSIGFSKHYVKIKTSFPHSLTLVEGRKLPIF